ncbi:hypothetical protein Dimus_013278, partial [Dionaea muscipula]
MRLGFSLPQSPLSFTGLCSASSQSPASASKHQQRGNEGSDDFSSSTDDLWQRRVFGGRQEQADAAHAKRGPTTGRSRQRDKGHDGVVDGDA